MSYVVTSKVKDFIKSRDMNSSGDLTDALDIVMEHKLEKAVERAKANDRKTVRPSDL